MRELKFIDSDTVNKIELLILDNGDCELYEKYNELLEHSPIYSLEELLFKLLKYVEKEMDNTNAMQTDDSFVIDAESVFMTIAEWGMRE